MSPSTFELIVPALLRGLDVLRVYVERIDDAIARGGLDGATIFKASLAPDMLPLGRQFQMACDNAKNGASRLAGRPAPSFPDDETTTADFRSRIERTQAWLRTFTLADFEASESRLVDQRFRGANYAMTGGDYLRAVLLPNFYFHVATVHGILRLHGVKIGKDDYFGALPRIAPGIAFLTLAESKRWLEKQQVAENPSGDDAGVSHFRFSPQPVDVDLMGLFGALLEDVGPFTGGLLKLTDWIWDDEYDVDPTASFREASGEKRPLFQVPGMLFSEQGIDQATTLLALVVERRWSGTFYLQSKSATLRLREGDQVDVYSADAGVERRIRFRLRDLGIPVDLP
jgi:hypothetical protein